MRSLRYDIYPARGRKRFGSGGKFSNANRLRYDIYPARGRKLPHLESPEVLLFVFATIFTPQGDGNVAEDLADAEDLALRYDIYPARGRKPSIDVILPDICILLFATIFTPQGDGNQEQYTKYSLAVKAELRYDIYPARGRKQIINWALSWALLFFATIFTPQGDGNQGNVLTTSIAKATSLRYLPRKGTETLYISIVS